MDLKIYYRKIREVTETITGDFVVLVSHETPDGGKAGVMTEVAKGVAARLIVDGRARLATPEEADSFAKSEGEKRALAQEELAPNRWPVAFLSGTEIGALKAAKTGTAAEGTKPQPGVGESKK